MNHTVTNSSSLVICVVDNFKKKILMIKMIAWFSIDDSLEVSSK